MHAAPPQGCPHVASLYSQVPRTAYRTVRRRQLETQEAPEPATELCKEATPRYYQPFGSAFVFQPVLYVRVYFFYFPSSLLA